MLRNVGVMPAPSPSSAVTPAAAAAGLRLMSELTRGSCSSEAISA